jgi:hypothetical protein
MRDKHKQQELYRKLESIKTRVAAIKPKAAALLVKE